MIAVEYTPTTPEEAHEIAVNAYCSYLVYQGEKLQALRDDQDRISESRRNLTDELFKMLAHKDESGVWVLPNGKQSMKRGKYLLKLGTRKSANFCSCHGAFLWQCDTIGEVTVLPGRMEPYLSVSEVAEPA